MASGRTAVFPLLARRFLGLAVEAERRSDSELARSHFLMAIRHDCTPSSGLALAQFLMDQDLLDDVALVLNDCWQLARRRECPHEIADCCRRLATLHLKQGDESQAGRFIQRAAEAEMAAWGARDASLSCEQLLLESQLAAHRGEMDRAAALCRGALERSTVESRAGALRQRAALELLEGHRKSAAKTLLAAARAARQADDERQYAESMLELAHVVRALGRRRLAAHCYAVAASAMNCLGRAARAKAARRHAHEMAAIERTSGANPDWN